MITTIRTVFSRLSVEELMQRELRMAQESLLTEMTALDEARANVPIAEAKVASCEAKVQFHSARIDRLRSMLDQQVSRGGAA